MPVERHVHVVERSGPRHVDLARATLLGGRPVDADRPAGPRALEPLPDGDPGRGRGGPEQVVSAGVPRVDVVPHTADRNAVLGDPRQRVELGEDGDDRPPLATAGDEGRRHPGNPRLDGESGFAQCGLQPPRAFRLLVADLRQLPDFPGHAGVVIGPGVDRLGDAGVHRDGLGRRDPRCQHEPQERMFQVHHRLSLRNAHPITSPRSRQSGERRSRQGVTISGNSLTGFSHSRMKIGGQGQHFCSSRLLRMRRVTVSDRSPWVPERGGNVQEEGLRTPV